MEIMDEDVVSDDHVGATFLSVGNLIIKGGVNEWFEIYYKQKSAGTVHLATTWQPATKKPQAEESKEARPSIPASRPSVAVPDGKRLKMLLTAASLNPKLLTQFNNCTIYTVIKLGKGEMRSKPASSQGLETTWTQEQVDLEFTKTSNVVYIEVRDKDKPSGKMLAEGQLSVENFLGHSGQTCDVKVFTKDSAMAECGAIRFEVFDQSSVKRGDVDPNYPHVKLGCMVCKDSHSNTSGTPWSCLHCVCIKCKGSGLKPDGSTCAAIKCAS